MKSPESPIGNAIDSVYGSLDGNPLAEAYADRHGIESAAILTIMDDERAGMTAEYLAPRVKGKTVVEIGGGIGLLGCHLALHASHVYVIEANPMWSAIFVWELYAKKPKNLTFILGAAEEMHGVLRADVALYCTLSGRDAMRRAAEPFAPLVLDVYDELLGHGVIDRETDKIRRKVLRMFAKPPEPR